MTDSIQARLGRTFDPAELRRIKRLWVRHSIAEDRRDIEGLIATLAPTSVYEMIPTGQRWDGHDGARAFYAELFAAFPDNRFALTEIVVGPQGVFEVATLTGTNVGPWGGAAPSGLPVSLQVVILFPWDPATERFLGERIWFDRGELGGNFDASGPAATSQRHHPRDDADRDRPGPLVGESGPRPKLSARIGGRR